MKPNQWKAQSCRDYKYATFYDTDRQNLLSSNRISWFTFEHRSLILPLFYCINIQSIAKNATKYKVRNLPLLRLDVYLSGSLQKCVAPISALRKRLASASMNENLVGLFCSDTFLHLDSSLPFMTRSGLLDVPFR